MVAAVIAVVVGGLSVWEAGIHDRADTAPASASRSTPVSDALATVDCDKNTMPGGPYVARYPDQTTLDRRFEAAIKEDEQLMACPGSSTMSPTTWHDTATPERVGGAVLIPTSTAIRTRRRQGKPPGGAKGWVLCERPSRRVQARGAAKGS